jgi:hypothetical protein
MCETIDQKGNRIPRIIQTYGTMGNNDNFAQNSKQSTNDIFNKLKSRLPMFILVIYCSVTSQIYGNDVLKGTIQTSDKKMFIFYYASLSICAIAWDVWHAAISYKKTMGEKTTIYGMVCFCSISLSISYPLFLVATNIVSFGLPFNMICGYVTQNNMLLICGSILPIIYFLTIIESYYWKSSVEQYMESEANDDIQQNSDANIFA